MRTFENVWVGIALFISVAGLLSGQGALLGMGLLLFTMVLVAWGWNHYGLRRVSYQRQLSEQRAFVGEVVTLTLSLTNAKPLPLPWVRVDDAIQKEIEIADHTLAPSATPGMRTLVTVASLGWYERVFWEYRIPCKARGFYFLGPAVLHSGDIFGIFEHEVPTAQRDRLIVYPEVVPLAALGLPAKDPFGLRRAPQPLFEDPSRTKGIRDYQPDDPLRRVHWKASARAQKLQVRLWEPTEAHQVVVFINVATFERHWEGMQAELLEQTISVAASIAMGVFQDGQMVGVFANAAVPQSDQPVKVLPGRNPDQLRAILEALAALTLFPTATIEQLLGLESSRLPWGATLVIVTPIVSEALKANLLRLHQVGRRLALVSLDARFTPDHEFELPGILVYHITPRVTLALDEVVSPNGASSQTREIPRDDPDALFKRPERAAL